ncbi:hypothetical protein BFP70_09515 [Thioclava sp. SK-1]|uniref:NAD(P)/FAD-dependent oxidoreductase n=1 Tax=Thioclava sp. SK-1 TaxID=1889770 RepID=UPI000826AB76|nr:hypothetical protein BFP70_09515 [Thioclava sp. SK-1]
MKERLVIIGAGMASGRLLDHLIAECPDRFDITIFNAEPRGCYNRIMLSPVLSGEKAWEEIVTHDAAFYDTHGVTCRFGETVTAIDTDAQRVTGENGTVAYDQLIFATGSQPFIIPMPGHDLQGVLAYRDLDDTNKMIAAANAGGRAVVIGGGLLGLEAAAGLQSRGMDVTVVHLMDHLMERQLDPTAGRLLQNALAARGINVLCGAQSEKILGENGHVRALALKDGRELPCDILVMAVGIRPNVGLAKATGLDCNRGIVVDASMRSTVPAVSALGECVEHDGQLFGLVAPLYDQARVLADRLQGRAAEFVAQELSTKLKVTGCDLFSAGDFADDADREDIILTDPQNASYKRLVVQDNRLIGAVIYGDTSDANWFFGLIKNGTDIAQFRDTLIFGPAYQDDGATPDLCGLAA